MLKKNFSHESLISKIQEIGEKSNLIFYFISSNFISYYKNPVAIFSNNEICIKIFEF